MFTELMIAANLSTGAHKRIVLRYVGLGEKCGKVPYFHFRVLTSCDNQISMTRRIGPMRQIQIIDGEVVRVLNFSDELSHRKLIDEHLALLRSANE